MAVGEQRETDRELITDFVPKPLYTKRQLRAFRDRNVRDGVFRTTKDTVQSVEDLEKMMFLWQESVGGQQGAIALGGELQSEAGFTFSDLRIDIEQA